MRDCNWPCAAAQRPCAKNRCAFFSCCPTASSEMERLHQPEPGGLRPLVHPRRVRSMPLSGFWRGELRNLIQQRETLSGWYKPTGDPATCLYGGSPAIFDVRYETTPMGAIETLMINCANSEVGKSLGHADPGGGLHGAQRRQQLDSQPGLETGMGAMLRPFGITAFGTGC